MSRSTSRYVDRGPYFVLWFTKWTPKKELKITSNSGVTCFTRANFSLYSTSSEGGSFGTWITTEDSPWMICSTGYLASYQLNLTLAELSYSLYSLEVSHSSSVYFSSLGGFYCLPWPLSERNWSFQQLSQNFSNLESLLRLMYASMTLMCEYS